MVGIAGDLHPVEEFFRRALASKCEGIMVKILDNEVVAKGSDIVEDQEEIDGITGYPEDTKPDVGPEATENGLAGLITPSKGKRSLNNKGSRKMLLPASYEPDK